MTNCSGPMFETFSKICYQVLGDGDSDSCFVLMESPGLPPVFLALSSDAENAIPIDKHFIPQEYGNGMEVLNMLKEDWNGSIRVLYDNNPTDNVDFSIPETQHIHFKNKKEFIEIIYRFVDDKYTVKDDETITQREIFLMGKLISLEPHL
jgi:hypothetical protein